MISTVKVRIENGRAILTGTVKSEDEKKEIENALQRVSTVTNVDNQLQVSSTEPSTEQSR